MHAPIAQLDRVTGYEPVGRGFESLSAYQTNKGIPKRVSPYLFCTSCRKGLEELNAVRMSTAADGLTEANNNLLPQEQMQTSPFRRTPPTAAKERITTGGGSEPPPYALATTSLKQATGSARIAPPFGVPSPYGIMDTMVP